MTVLPNFPKILVMASSHRISVGWNIAQEKFMEHTQNWLGSLKLRASYGMIGNQNVPAYSFIPTMTVNNKIQWMVVRWQLCDSHHFSSFFGK